MRRLLPLTVLRALPIAALALGGPLACHDEPAARSKPAEEPFKLAPGDDDDGGTTTPTDVTPSAGDTDAGATTWVAETPEIVMKDCPTGKGPSDLIVKPEPARKGADAGGAGGVARVILDNRRSIPRTVEVTGVERLDGATGSPLKITRVTADEGGGGFPQSKMMLQSQATMHLVVEFDPATPPPYRVHFSVDDEAACIESPATNGAHKGPAAAPAHPRGKKK